MFSSSNTSYVSFKFACTFLSDSMDDSSGFDWYLSKASSTTHLSWSSIMSSLLLFLLEPYIYERISFIELSQRIEKQTSCNYPGATILFFF